MSLKDQLAAARKDAMKTKDKLSLETIRSLLSAIQYEEMNKKTDALSEEQLIAVVKAEAKKLRETKEYAEKADRPETVAETDARLAVLDRFLPSQLSEQELEKIVVEYSESESAANVGLVMKYLKENYSGRYDGKLASDVVKRTINT